MTSNSISSARTRTARPPIWIAKIAVLGKRDELGKSRNGFDFPPDPRRAPELHAIPGVAYVGLAPYMKRPVGDRPGANAPRSVLIVRNGQRFLHFKPVVDALVQLAAFIGVRVSVQQRGIDMEMPLDERGGHQITAGVKCLVGLLTRPGATSTIRPSRQAMSTDFLPSWSVAFLISRSSKAGLPQLTRCCLLMFLTGSPADRRAGSPDT